MNKASANVLVQVDIDNKHSIIVLGDGHAIPQLAKRKADGRLEPIPANEPVIVFRARDRLALPMLRHYQELCRADGATEWQLASMDDVIRKFEAYAVAGPMKQPGSTQGM